MAAWPALVPEETWRAVVEILTDPSRRNAPRSGQGLLTGVARCGVCGATVHRGATPPRNGRPGYANYRCRAAMGHLGRAVRPVDEYVSVVAVARLERADAASLLIDDVRPGAADLRRDAAALRTRLESLAGLFAEGVLSEVGVRRESAKLRTKLAEVESLQASAGRISTLQPLIGADDVWAAWEAMDTDRQRAAIETLMTVTLMPPGRGTRTFRPESVVIDWAA